MSSKCHYRQNLEVVADQIATLSKILNEIAHGNQMLRWRWPPREFPPLVWKQPTATDDVLERKRSTRTKLFHRLFLVDDWWSLLGMSSGFQVACTCISLSSSCSGALHGLESPTRETRKAVERAGYNDGLADMANKTWIVRTAMGEVERVEVSTRFPGAFGLDFARSAFSSISRFVMGWWEWIVTKALPSQKSMTTSFYIAS